MIISSQTSNTLKGCQPFNTFWHPKLTNRRFVNQTSNTLKGCQWGCQANKNCVFVSLTKSSSICQWCRHSKVKDVWKCQGFCFFLRTVVGMSGVSEMWLVCNAIYEGEISDHIAKNESDHSFRFVSTEVLVFDAQQRRRFIDLLLLVLILSLDRRKGIWTLNLWFWKPLFYHWNYSPPLLFFISSIDSLLIKCR